MKVKTLRDLHPGGNLLAGAIVADDTTEARHFFELGPPEGAHALPHVCELPDEIDQAAAVDRLLQQGRFEVTAQIKSVDEGTRTIEGYASTRDIDRVGEIILPSAWKDSLGDIKAGMVKMLWEHGLDRSWGLRPVGKIVAGKIDKVGLWVRGKFTGAADSEWLWTRILEGTVDSLSVGFAALDDRWQKFDGVDRRVITKAALFETTFTGMPANVRATFDVPRAIAFGTDLVVRKSGEWAPYSRAADQQPAGDKKLTPAPAGESEDRELAAYERTLAYLKRVNAGAADGDRDADIRAAAAELRHMNAADKEDA